MPSNKWYWQTLLMGKRIGLFFVWKGNNFEYKSSGRYQFFWSIFWKLPILPNGRIFRFREKNLREYCVRTRNLGYPDRCAKKTNLNCHPKMPSKNSPKTTLLHTWWLEVKKVTVERLSVPKWLDSDSIVCQW